MNELAGLIIAMGTKIPIHVGIDNAAVVSKAYQLITIAKRAEDAGAQYVKKPLKTIWTPKRRRPMERVWEVTTG